VKHGTPWLGLALLLLVGWMAWPTRASAQLGVFGADNPDGGDGGGFLAPRRYITNPWKQDAGNVDSGPGLADIFKPFQGGTGGFLKTRAPAINDLMDSDASFLPGGDGGFGFSIPSFGADIDAGQKDPGPVVAPLLRVARAYDDVTALTTVRAPHGTVWSRLPDDAQPRLKAAWPMRNGAPAPFRFDVLKREERTRLWAAASSSRGSQEGAAAFILSPVGTPVTAHLVVLGARGGVFYGGFAAPRDGVQPVDPRVVMQQSGNVGRFKVAQPPRPSTNARLLAGLNQLSVRMGAPFGREQPPALGTPRVAVLRTSSGMRVEVQVQEARAPRSAPPVCFEVSLDGDGHILAQKDWSPVCDHWPVTAIDVDGDGLDEALWREGGALVLRRYPGGEVLDQDG
jgi:hypothetical protein